LINGLFILNNLSKKYNSSNIGLYRDDGLAVFKNINGHQADKIRKDFHSTFRKHGLELEIECNLKIVNFLDVTLNLNNNTHQPFKKPNDETIYVHSKSNHPKNIIQQLPISIENRLSSLSSNEEIFKQTSIHYQNALNKSGYQHTLTYNKTQTTTPKTNKNNRKRKIIWFNPPFNKNNSFNIGKHFLKLIQKHFPKQHKYSKIFNRNTLKISYSCTSNIKSIINSHNKTILNEHNYENERQCNCINKEKCPLDNKCLSSNIVYKSYDHMR